MKLLYVSVPMPPLAANSIKEHKARTTHHAETRIPHKHSFIKSKSKSLTQNDTSDRAKRGECPCT